MKQIIAFTAVLWLTLWSALAAALPPKVYVPPPPAPPAKVEDQLTITFQVDADAGPTRVCVLSDWWDPDWHPDSSTHSQNLGEWAAGVASKRLAAAAPAGTAAAPAGSGAAPPKSADDEIEDLFVKLGVKERNRDENTCEPSALCRRGYPDAIRASLEEALAAGASAGSGPAPAKRQRRLVCAQDSAALDSRVVVLAVTFAAPDLVDVPQLRAPRVLGSTAAAIGLSNLADGNKGDGEKLAVNVVGGDYLAYTESGVNDKGKVTLRLVPRCRKSTVELPPGVAGDKLAVFLDPAQAAICNAPKVDDRRWFQAWLPSYTTNGARTLRVITGTGHSGATVTDTWTTREAPEVLHPSLREVAFSWRPDCMYGGQWDGAGDLEKSSCPAVRLAGGAVSCAAQLDGPEKGVCYYRCGVQAASAQASSGATNPSTAACWKDATGQRPPDSVFFDLPVRAQFCGAGNETWEEGLSYAGQELSGFVPLADRHLMIDLTQWSQPSAAHRLRSDFARLTAKDITSLVVERPGAAIRWIMLRDSTGAEHVVAPDPGQRVALPGARCGDVLTFTIEGDRGYEPGYATVNHGRISLPHPEQQEERLGFAVTLSSAFLTDVRAGGQLFQSSFSGYRNETWHFGAGFRASAVIRPKGWPVELEPTFVYMIAQQPYFPIRESTRDSNVESSEVAYNHFGAEWAAVWFPPCWHGRGVTTRIFECKNVGIGFAGGFLVTQSLNGKEELLVGSSQVLPTMSTFVRWYWTKNVSFQAMARLLFDDRVYYKAVSKLGSVGAVSDSTTVADFELGIRFGP